MTTYDKEYLQERHLRGELTAEEQTAFEEMLASDPAFAREVKAGELAVEGLKSLHIHQRIQEVRNQVVEQQKESVTGSGPVKKQSRVISMFRRPLSIAASVALLIAAAYFIYLSFGSQSLYDQYNQHPTFSVTEMSASADYDLSRAESAFQQGNYEATQQELSAYLNANPTDTLALLFQGICHLELDNFSQAEGVFSDIQAGASDFRDLGEWYLALTFLKQEDTERAREVLSNIAQDSEKFIEAQKLLSSLGK